MSEGFVILAPDAFGLDFVDCTPTISATFQEAQQELREWFGDVPGAAIFRLVRLEDGSNEP